MTDPAISRRNKAARRRGAQWQSDVRDSLRGGGYDVEMLTLTGAQDEGDLVVRMEDGTYVVIEAKNEKTIDLPTYLREAHTEAENFAKHRPHLAPEKIRPIAVVKARGKSVLDAYVVQRLSDVFPKAVAP